MKTFGALGNWNKIDEKFDLTIIKQVNDASCVSAVGEMLATYYGLDLSQTEILETIGIWSNAQSLARFLNSKEPDNSVEWIGGNFPQEPKYVRKISEKNVWAVMLREGRWDGHAVFIDGIDKDGKIIIKDPFDQTTYKMNVADLYNVLSEFVLRRKKQ